MIETVIKTSISVIVSGALGYCISKIKGYKKKLKQKDDENNLTKEAMMIILQGSITNTFYVYDEMGEIPDYVLKGWYNQKNIYEKLGGDDYVHVLEEKIKDLKIKKTGVL